MNHLLLAWFLYGMVYADPTIVQTADGLVQGTANNGVLVWNSIPYAAPPLGDFRFQPPKEVTPWSGVLECISRKNVCPQFDIDGVYFYGDEDCLTLDVYVPQETNITGPLPVMVWMYGGGFMFGDKYEFGLYDATASVRTRGHIHVAMNYRLNALGFLALQELMDESPVKTTGNYGTQDQLAALTWVQKNIKNFGGDPSRVTIFGESAGAFSVCWHLVNPASANLFSAAIMESGTCDSIDFFVPLDKAQAWSYDYAAMLGCKDKPTILSCLRALPARTILYPNFSVPPPTAPRMYPLLSWSPTIDGSFAGLSDNPLVLIQSGKFNKVPVILGTNQDEGSIFLFLMVAIIPGVDFPITQAGATTLLNYFFNDTTTQEILELYDTEPTWEYVADTVLRDYFFACSARRVARALSDIQHVPAYLYHFTFNPGWIDIDILGQYHSSEIEFVFDNPWPPIVHEFSANGRKLADAIGIYWDNLGRYGTPNGNLSLPNGLPLWTVYDSMDQPIIRLDIPIRMDSDFFGRYLFFLGLSR